MNGQPQTPAQFDAQRPTIMKTTSIMRKTSRSSFTLWPLFLAAIFPACQTPQSPKEKEGVSTNTTAAILLPLETLLTPVTTAPEINSRAEQIVMQALNRINGRSGEGQTTPAKLVTAYADKPLFSEGKEFSRAMSHVSEGGAVGLAVVQEERIGDAISIVETALQLAQFITSDEKKDFLKLLSALTGWQGGLGQGINNFSINAEAQWRSRRRSSGNLSSLNNQELPPPTRNTPPSGDFIKAINVERGNFGSGGYTLASGCTFRTTVELFRCYDTMTAASIVQSAEGLISSLQTAASSMERMAQNTAAVIPQMQVNDLERVRKGLPSVSGEISQVYQAKDNWERLQREYSAAADGMETATRAYFAFYANKNVAASDDLQWSERVRVLEAAGRYKDADAAANAAATSAARFQGSRAYGVPASRPALLNRRIHDNNLGAVQFAALQLRPQPGVILAANKIENAAADEWNAMLSDSLTSIRIGKLRDARRLGEKLVTAKPNAWEGYFVQFLVSVHVRRWSSAAEYLQQAVEQGYLPDIHPASTLMFLRQMMTLELSDERVKRLNADLDGLSSSGKLTNSAIIALLRNRDALSRSEDVLASALAAACPRWTGQNKKDDESVFPFHRLSITNPLTLIEPWKKSQAGASHLTASLLRKLTSAGCIVFAIPIEQANWPTDYADIEVESWKPVWVAEYSAKQDPEGFAFLREAEFRARRIKSANQSERKQPFTRSHVDRIAGSMPLDTFSLRTTNQLKQTWSLNRNDGWREMIVEELKCAPTSLRLWALLNSSRPKQGPFSLSVDDTHKTKLNHTLLLATWLAAENQSPGIYTAAFRCTHLELKDGGFLPEEDEKWFQTNLVRLW